MSVTDDFKFTIEDVASLFNRCPETIFRLIKNKKLVAEKRLVPRNDKFKFSRKYLISEKSVEKYFDTLNPLTLNVSRGGRPLFAKKKVEITNKSKAKLDVSKSTAAYLDKIKKVHMLVNEFGGLDSFKKTFKLYCIYSELFESTQ